MKRAALAIVLGLFLWAPCSLARAQGEFALDEQEIGAEPPAVASRVRQYVPALPGKPYGVKDLPEGLSDDVIYYTMRPGRKPILLLADLGETPKLYVDTDGDLNLAEERPLEAVKPPGEVVMAGMSIHHFGPVALRVGADGAAVHARFQVTVWEGGGGYMEVHPGVFRSGQVELGGESYRVQLVDGGFDGHYDRTIARSRSEYDWLAIDLDGDGQFDPRPYESPEILPLTKLLRVKDAFYSVAVAPDGSSITLAKAEPALGALDVGVPAAQLTVMSDSGYFVLGGSEGKWDLPTGRYVTRGLALSATDEKGDRWVLRMGSKLGKLSTFRIREDETTSVKMGPPLTVQTDARQASRGQVAIGLSVTGQGGEEYTAGVTKNGSTGSPPKFKIVDESGKVLTSGAVEYG